MPISEREREQKHRRHTVEETGHRKARVVRDKV